MIRCAQCKAFTSNNVATVGFDTIKAARGDCWRHGEGVEVVWEAWEDWGWSDEDVERIENELIASMGGQS